MDYIAASFRHRSACSRTIKTNCSNAGDRHFFRCNANCVATRCDSSFQFSFTSLPSSSSLRTVTRGKKETPSPEITHCLIASMLQNSKFESLAFVSDVLLYSRHAALRNRDNVTQHADPISERNLYSHVHGRLRCRNSAPQRQPYRRCPQLDFVCGYSRRIPFTGWAMLYPLLIALLCLGIQLRFSRRKATSLDI